MNQASTFFMYFGMNLHFTSLEFSVLKYGTITKAAQSKYESLSRACKYRFEWLSDKFPATQDLVYAYIGSQFDSVNAQFDSKEEVLDAYIKFKSRRESLTYSIKGDIANHESINMMPIQKLIFKYFVGEYSPEYIILLCEDSDVLFELYNSPNLVWAKDKILKLIKYKSFFNVSKFSHLIVNQQ